MRWQWKRSVKKREYRDDLGIRTAYKGTAEPEGNTLDKERMEEDKELIEKILAEREINRAGVDECMV